MKVEKSDPQLETLVSRITSGDLDLQPDFQRGEVWDTRRRRRLIDTILRGWYVPAIHVVVDSEGKEEVLDGQQRLVAIRDFFADKLRIDGSIEPHDDEIFNLNGLRYSKLPDKYRKAVNRFVLPMITLTGYDPQEPNELFFRLNQAFNLTPPEKRNALHGKARDQVKQLVRDLVQLGLLERSKIGFDNGRLAYDDIVARTCVAVELGNLRQHINNSTVEDSYRAGPFSDTTIEGVRMSAHLLLGQIEQSDVRIKFNKGTLQTWLIYCYWAPIVTGEIPPQLLVRFEKDRGMVRKGIFPALEPMSQAIAGIMRLYDDRASYRVTDVSSVLIRDLAIHVFSEAAFQTHTRRSSDQLLLLLQSEPELAQTAVADYLESVRWGDALIDY